ncbi:hypothetical protein ACE1ET_01845 [Saccharicrinis sp. FJH62]|uniref:hypothetical protein n=1 Tax=Saccharicrinis sp. FJH62 TaxID=3344657 RepID=UPI0035D4F99B
MSDKLEWIKYQGTLIPLVAPHISILPDKREQKRLLKLYKPFFLRYYSEWDNGKGEFWFVIKDGFKGLEELSSKTRNQVRKGLKNCIVKKVSIEEIEQNGYQVYIKAFEKYDTFLKPMSKDIFQMSLRKKNNYDFFAVYNLNGKIIAYSQNELYEDYCNLSITKFDPEFLKLRPSEALFYEMNRYYLDDCKLKYVCDGARSLSHDTNIQDFLIDKFKFRKAYCKLNIVYRKDIGLLVKLIYPLRTLLRLFPERLTRKIKVLLKHEEIRRSYCE